MRLGGHSRKEKAQVRTCHKGRVVDRIQAVQASIAAEEVGDVLTTLSNSA